MQKSIKEIVFEIGDSVAEKIGVSLIDASLDKENKEKFLRLYIDKPGGVSLDDCEKYSRAFEEEIDRIDPIKDAYCLEVNSPGVDRVLKTKRELEYYIGRDVDIKLYGEISGKKEFSAKLKSYDGDSVTVDADGEDISIPLSKAVYIKLMFRF